MAFSRSSGILLHPTSFPSRFGIGDLGLESFRFIDFLVDSGQQYWQVLPIGPTGYGNSPYMSYAALAGNPLLISPDKLIDEGWLNEGDFTNLPEFPAHTVEYDRVYEVKIPLLKKACENFKANASELQRREFEGFCETKAYWLDDYALFMALKEAHEGASWNTWEADIAKHKPEAIEKWRSQLSDAVYYYKYTQFEFFRQWTELRRYANLRGIQIIGDIPIYVAHDSADVWAHPEAFALDEETGAAALMAGVPPDYFSATGQLWGNPVYNWEHLQQTHFQWWVERFQAMLDYVDLIRIDHFRGFQAYWVVLQGEETAMNGKWVEAPGEEFFKTLNDKLGKLPVLAEDLGVITPEVEALRDQFEFPGMKVLQFAFGDDPGNPFLPFNYPRNCVVYTGTHDNDTTVGWFNQLSDYEKEKVRTYLGHFSPDGIQWDLIRLAMSSIANIAIIPVQDLLGLGTDARMNFPSKAEGNWAWRYQSGTLTQELSQRLKQLTFSFGRAPIPQHSESY
ncbi:MAG: 4-alpha-glucanotransferase [Desertifilum sp. SIO1I2]|nr:4-alpha-glucanotransferase [Desertifilum sp. SIO1I2]